jgi:glyoxylase-like metal-dependent hydrolase (beta-lactamase superfamily II)
MALSLHKRPWSYNPFAKARTPIRVLPNITLLGSSRINFYALTEGRSITLIDCGFYGHLRYLEAWLAHEGRKLTDVEAVAITHGHADHLGFAAIFGEMGIPVYVPQLDLAFAQTTRVRRPPPRLLRKMWRPSSINIFFEAACDSVFTQPAVENAIGYSPGELLDAPGRLQAIHVPGHSAGNCSLYFPNADVLFAGDSLMTLDPMTGHKGPLVFAEDPKKNEEAFSNLTLLKPFATAALLPAHGEPLTEPGALGRAIEQARIV